jgi:hypothetical protein
MQRYFLRSAVACIVLSSATTTTVRSQQSQQSSQVHTPVSRGWRRYYLRSREDCVELDRQEFSLFKGSSQLAQLGNWLFPSSLTPWTEGWDKKHGSVEFWLQHDELGNCTLQRTTVRGDGLVSANFTPRSHADKGQHHACHLPNSAHGQVVDGVLYLHDGIPGLSDDSGAPPPTPDPFLLNPHMKRFQLSSQPHRLSTQEWHEHAPTGQCCKMSAIVNHADGRVLEFGHASGGQPSCQQHKIHGCILDGHFHQGSVSLIRPLGV